jgi:threonine synthase
VTLRGALLTGQAPDKGLYMPRLIPRIPRNEVLGFKDKTYPEVAWAILRRFTAGLVPDDELLAICRECYDYDVPLECVHDQYYVLRLDQGPTASFKDFAARMTARLMCYFLKADGGELVILTATSGDTGSAVAHAFHNIAGINLVVLFPKAEVSDRQRRQMTTLGGNVTVIGIDGQFDDCQALVRRAFADPDLKGIRFSSANSINIGRLLPQAVYYFYAYARLTKNGESCVVSIPSGNFGNMCGAMIAWRMGLPAERYVIATNANDEFPRFVEYQLYRKIEPSRVCISNAMNVGHPSNLPRLVALYGGMMDETGRVHKAPDFTIMRRELFPVSINDDETRTTIVETWQKYKVMLEPHGAVGWAALGRFLNKGYRPNFAISIATAHPAKFPDEIKNLLGIEPELPPSLAGLDAKPEQYESGPNDYEWFKDSLMQKFG